MCVCVCVCVCKNRIWQKNNLLRLICHKTQPNIIYYMYLHPLNSPSRHGSRFNTKTYIECLEEILLCGLREWLLEDLTSGNMTLHPTTQAEKPSGGYQKVSKTISPLTSDRQTTQIEIPVIVICGIRSCETPTKL